METVHVGGRVRPRNDTKQPESSQPECSQPSSSSRPSRSQPLKSSRPQRVPYPPPQWAKASFALVALRNGEPLSLHCDLTYPLDATLLQATLSEAEGALYVMGSEQDAVLREHGCGGEQGMVRKPHTRDLPLAIARVLAWNADRMEVARQHGAKKAYSFIRLVGLLDLTPAHASMLAPPVQRRKEPTAVQLLVQQEEERRAASRASCEGPGAGTGAAEQDLRPSALSLRRAKEGTAALLGSITEMEADFKRMRGIV